MILYGLLSIMILIISHLMITINTIIAKNIYSSSEILPLWVWIWP